jgi:hypothetical protein
MAFIEVEADEPVSHGEFFKFNAIGDTLGGWYLGCAENTTGKYGPQMNYYFRLKDGSERTVNGSVDIDRKMSKALASGLKEGMCVVMKYTKDLPPTVPGRSPMKIVGVKYDPTGPACPKKAAAPAAPAVDADPFA